MSNFKTHMVFYADNEGSFRTGCKIDDFCSEDFYDNAKLVAFGNDSETTCKKCLAAYQKEVKSNRGRRTADKGV